MLLWRVDYDSEPAYCKIFGHHVGYILPIHTQSTQTFSPLVTKFLLFRLISSRNGVFSYNRDVVPKNHWDLCCGLFWRYFYWRWRDWFGDTWTNIVMELLLMDLFSNASRHTTCWSILLFPVKKCQKQVPLPPHSPLVPSNVTLSTRLQPLRLCHTE